MPHHIQRTRWLLEHGADARGINFYSREPVIKHAVLAGREDMVELLVRHRAARPGLTENERFFAATVAGDFAKMRELALKHPEFLQSHEPMFAVIRLRRADIAAALLDLGMSVDVGDEKNLRALHYTTHCGAEKIARLLIARGAQIDPFELRYGGTPLTHAVYNRQTQMVNLLASVSRNFRGLCYAGAVDGVRELLTEAPDRANRHDRDGEPALFCLPDDDEKSRLLNYYCRSVPTRPFVIHRDIRPRKPRVVAGWTTPRHCWRTRLSCDLQIHPGNGISAVAHTASPRPLS